MTPRGCAPNDLDKYKAPLLRQLASTHCQQEFEKQQKLGREMRFKERLILTLGCPPRVRDLLITVLQP